LLLSMIEDGTAAVVSRIDGGRMMRSRLLQLGIIPGVPIRKVRGGVEGPFILEVLGSSVMLGRGMANAIEVRV